MRVVPGKRRCRFHGGLSTGPKTKAGRAKAFRSVARLSLGARPSNKAPMTRAYWMRNLAKSCSTNKTPHAAVFAFVVSKIAVQRARAPVRSALGRVSHIHEFNVAD
jgi:hypothetical protein